MEFTLGRAYGYAEQDAVPVLLDEVHARGFRLRTQTADRNHDTLCAQPVGSARGPARDVTPDLGH
jgi:hypothetical protein